MTAEKPTREDEMLRRCLGALNITHARYQFLPFLYDVGFKKPPHFTMGQTAAENYPSFLEYAEKIGVHPNQAYRAKQAFEKHGLIINAGRRVPSATAGQMTVYSVPATTVWFIHYLLEASNNFKKKVAAEVT